MTGGVKKTGLLSQSRIGRIFSYSRQCLTVPVGDVMNRGNNSHKKDNGTVTTNGSRSSSCHSRALQGVTGCSVAQQSIGGRSRTQPDTAGYRRA